MSNRTLLAIVMSAGALAACGGGGDGGEPAEPQSTFTTGFTTGGGEYLWLSNGILSTGKLNLIAQRKDDNAIITINENALEKDGIVRDINNDANFAMGRWVEGKLTTPAGEKPIAESDATLPHYILFKRAASFPSSGSAKCEKSAFTVPSYLGGANPGPSAAGAGEGSASIAFTPAGTVVTLSLSASNGSNGMTPLNASGTVSVPTGSYTIGDLSKGDSAFVTVGRTEKGYQVVGKYTLNLSSQAKYSGLFRFSCE